MSLIFIPTWVVIIGGLLALFMLVSVMVLSRSLGALERAATELEARNGRGKAESEPSDGAID